MYFILNSHGLCYTIFDSIIFVKETRFSFLSYFFPCNKWTLIPDFILDFILDFVLDYIYLLYLLSYVLLCVVCSSMLYIMYSTYSKFYRSILYTTIDPIFFIQETRFCILSFFVLNYNNSFDLRIFVQVTRFCLLSYSFMYCILCFLLYFSCLYSVVFVLYLGHGTTTTTDIILAW